MKILLIGSLAESLVNFRGPLIADMIASGHSVVAAAPGIAAVANRLTALGAEPVETPLARAGLNPLADLAYGFRLRAIMKQHKPGIVLTYTIKPNIWGAFAARSLSIPSFAMVTGLGYAFTDTGQQAGIVQKLVSGAARLLYRAATGFNRNVIFQNPDDLADFVAQGCLADAHKARLVNGSGVDLSHYKATTLPDEQVFLMIARLLGNKGVREFATASKSVKQIHPEARFVLVGGEDPGPDGLRAADVHQMAGGALELAGHQGDVRPWIAEARVYVLPSYREGTPRSVLEAMASGRAVITSDAPGCRECVIDGTCRGIGRKDAGVHPQSETCRANGCARAGTGCRKI
jgi:glycosyltransferase involved in cell wall biosynthesis